MIQLYAHTDRLYTNIQDLPALGFIGVERLYFSSQVDAALAAKDARIAELELQIGAMYSEAFGPDALDKLRLDTTRLDKLPQCFHMLRHARGYWHLTYAPSKQYDTVREAIDAHVEPGVQP